jgi:hypothetical protein
MLVGLLFWSSLLLSGSSYVHADDEPILTVPEKLLAEVTSDSVRARFAAPLRHTAKEPNSHSRRSPSNGVQPLKGQSASVAAPVLALNEQPAGPLGFAPEKESETVLKGVVIDSVSKDPVGRILVRVNRAGRPRDALPPVRTRDDDGSFTVRVPGTPDWQTIDILLQNGAQYITKLVREDEPSEQRHPLVLRSNLRRALRQTKLSRVLDACCMRDCI